MQENSKNLNIQAIELASQGFYKEAIACLQKAISIDKYNYLLWYNLGVSYRDIGKMKDARNALLQAYNLNDTDEELLETLSLVYFSLNDIEEANRYSFECLDINPLNAHSWNNLGVFSFKQENYEEACEYFETALSIYPNYYDALYNLRDTYLELGNKAGAKQCTEYIRNLKSTGTLHGR